MSTNAYLHGIGHFHPENVVDNDFLESLDIGVDKEWILRRVGIRSRRTVLPLDYIRSERNRTPAAADEAALYSNAQIGCKAARMALARAAISPSDVGLVISGSSAPVLNSPAESCALAAELEIEAPAFDLNSACCTFVAQMWMVSRMIPEETPDFILMVQPESLTRTVNYSDRNTAVLMGDGATAAVVSLKVKAPTRVGFATFTTSPQSWRAAVIPAGGHFSLQGSVVQKFAIRKTIEILEGLSAHVPGDSYFIGHQANLTMLDAVCSRLSINADKHLFNVDEFGNCGSAGAPSVMSAHWNTFQTGEHLRMAVVGAGLTWAGLAFHFDSPISEAEKLTTSVRDFAAQPVLYA